MKNRLAVYNEQTRPLIAYYGENVKTVNGSLPEEAVFEEIVSVLEAV